MLQYKLAMITDEVSQDPDVIIAFALEQGMGGLELRSIADTPIDQLAPAEAEALASRFREAGLEVVALASSFGKVEDDAAFDDELAKLDRLIPLARIFNTRYIRGFAGFRDAATPEDAPLGEALAMRLARRLAAAESRLRDNGLELLLEADPSVYTSSHARLAELLEALDACCGGAQDSPFAAIYDPGNSVYAPGWEQPWPAAYEAIRPWLRHVHAKDAIRRDGEVSCLRIGDGEVDWPALLRGLARDGYRGWISLETHYRLTGQLDDESLKRPGGAAFSDGGLEATAESSTALRAMLDAI